LSGAATDAAIAEDPLYGRVEEMERAGELSPRRVSSLQRRLAIGYTRAARLVRMLRETGVLDADPPEADE
jgi:DNA segregation ATPase FtsK/SpoIIIE-like protein